MENFIFGTVCDSKTNTANVNPEHNVDLALLGILCKE